MRAITIGQHVEVDLFGLAVAGSTASRASGVVAALAPGAITVLVEHGLGTVEVTVSERRVESPLWR